MFGNAQNPRCPCQIGGFPSPHIYLFKNSWVTMIHVPFTPINAKSKKTYQQQRMHFSFLSLPFLVPWQHPPIVPPGRAFSFQPQPQPQHQQPLIFDNIEHSTTLAQDNPFDDKFERRAKCILDHFHVPGLSMAVVTGNNTFFKVFLFFSRTFSVYRRC